MQKPTEVLTIFEKYTPLVDDEIKSLISKQEPLLMYDMMSYFFGYLDENMKVTSGYGGKRFRPGLTLLCADFFGKQDKALGAATAIEIFHNFTLIHDDIEDNDPIRRGRPTVWKKWGVSHGINTGDTQLILSYKELGSKYADNPSLLASLNVFLSDIFQGVAEGQFMDFTLADKVLDDDYVSEKTYLEMIKRKSAILVAASAKVAGIVSGANESDLNNLWEYGLHLGYAYQLNDDLLSIWGNAKDTGKVEAKDIEEHKKTLPIIYLYSKLDDSNRAKFAKLFNKAGELTHDEITEIKSLLDERGAGEYVLGKITEHLRLAELAISKLSIAPEQKKLLTDINRALIPNLKWWECK